MSWGAPGGTACIGLHMARFGLGPQIPSITSGGAPAGWRVCGAWGMSVWMPQTGSWQATIPLGTPPCTHRWTASKQAFLPGLGLRDPTWTF